MVSLQHLIASLCNQLLSGFSRNQFKTLHRCYKHIEDRHVTFSKQKNNFDYGSLDLANFQIGFQYGVVSLRNQLLPEFSSNQL